MNPDEATPRPWNTIPNSQRKAAVHGRRLAEDAIATFERCSYCRAPMWTRDLTVEDVCDECDYVENDKSMTQRRAKPGESARPARSPLEDGQAVRMPQPFTSGEHNMTVRYNPFGAPRDPWRPR